MQLIQIVQLSATFFVFLCTVAIILLELKQRKLRMGFLKEVEIQNSNFIKEIEKTFSENADRNLKTLSTACSDGTKLLENKHRFLFENSMEAFRENANASRNELRNEIALYREELLQSLYAVRNETETKVVEQKTDALKVMANLISEMNNNVTNTTHDFTVKLKVFSQEAKQLIDQHYQIRKRDLDIQHDEIKDKLLEIFPPEKRSVFMNLSKGGMWTNKPDGKTI